MTDSTSNGDPARFREALGNFTTGVTIVTTRNDQGRDVGLTANSFNSVSLDPPMVLWSLAKTSLNLHAFVHAQYFAVHILSAEQRHLSELFASRGADKFAAQVLERGYEEIPLLRDCAARFECQTAFRYDGGDHEIFVGKVLRFEHLGRVPLVFHGGEYGLVTKQVKSRTGDRKAREDNGSTRDFLTYLVGSTYHRLLRPVHADLSRRGLSLTEYYLLGIVGADGDRTVEAARDLMSGAGHELTDGLIAGMQSRGLLLRAAQTLTLTALGRDTMIEMLAISKSAESDMEEELEYSESQLLKQLLRRLLRGVPKQRPA